MNELIQWFICGLIGLGALGYLFHKYAVRKDTPGAACGKCKACAASAQIAQLEAGAGPALRKRLPLGRR